ncbi:FHA domain-containing protein [Micromonospora sp. NPDC049044]|uniref:FHA domain-containing protein n=1 Tax=Micromonospora sp. NPDC049044 TaxID=3154827 RepID=UPI0034058FD3
MAALSCPNHGPQPAGGTFCPECMEVLVPETALATEPVCPVPGCDNPVDAAGGCPLHDLGTMATEVASYAEHQQVPTGAVPATTREAAPGGTAFHLEFPFGPVPIGHGELRIGRADDLGDIAARLRDHGNVSRQHALLWVEDGELYVRDLNSTNGTYVNDRQLDPRTRQRLSDGDELRLASTVRVRVRRTGGQR